MLLDASKAEGTVVVRGLEVCMHERTLRLKLRAQGKASVTTMNPMAIGFMAPLLSEKVWAEEDIVSEEVEAGVEVS